MNPESDVIDHSQFAQEKVFERIKRMHEHFPEMCSGKDCYCNEK